MTDFCEGKKLNLPGTRRNKRVEENKTAEDLGDYEKKKREREKDKKEQRETEEMRRRLWWLRRREREEIKTRTTGEREKEKKTRTSLNAGNEKRVLMPSCSFSSFATSQIKETSLELQANSRRLNEGFTPE